MTVDHIDTTEETLAVKIPRRRVFVPEAQYNPDKQNEITERTRLGKGVTIGKFMVTAGVINRPDLRLCAEAATSFQIAKQYSMHANAIRMVTESDRFMDHRLEVVEGYLNPDPSYDKNDSFNYLKTKGQCVVYELYNQEGLLDLFQIFELATFWKVNLEYEKLVLNYDTFNPNGSLHAQLILIMPEISAPWNVYYKNEIETRYNNYVQGTNEFIEVLEEDDDLNPAGSR